MGWIIRWWCYIVKISTFLIYSFPHILRILWIAPRPGGGWANPLTLLIDSWQCREYGYGCTRMTASSGGGIIVVGVYCISTLWYEICTLYIHVGLCEKQGSVLECVHRDSVVYFGTLHVEQRFMEFTRRGEMIWNHCVSCISDGNRIDKLIWINLSMWL